MGNDALIDVMVALWMCLYSGGGAQEGGGRGAVPSRVGWQEGVKVVECYTVGSERHVMRKGFMVLRMRVVAWTARCLTAHEATIAQ